VIDDVSDVNPDRVLDAGELPSGGRSMSEPDARLGGEAPAVQGGPGDFDLRELLHPVRVLRDPASRRRAIHRLAEVAKFGVVGGVAFLVNNAVFLLANGPLGWGPTWAKVASVAVATVVAYIGSRYWSFSERATSKRGRELIAFVAVNLVGLVVEMVPLWMSHYVLGFDTAWADWFSGVIIGTGIGTIFRYFAYRMWVFNEPD
jgi:putative flippase GtrA